MNAKDNWKIHYRRTLAFMEFLKLDGQRAKPSVDGTVDIHLLLIQFFQDQSHLNNDLLDRLNEICAIENEKLMLSNSKEEIDTILESEIGYCKSRHIILGNPISKILNSKFILSPFVKTFESYWDWFSSTPNDTSLSFKDILNRSAGDYYFLFQQTGTYDSLMGGNILESPLTEYQYFLLSIFESPSTIKSVMERFEQEFDYSTSQEKLQLRINTEALICDFIFKMFIVEV